MKRAAMVKSVKIETKNDDKTDVDMDDGEDLERFIDDFDNPFVYGVLWFPVFVIT